MSLGCKRVARRVRKRKRGLKLDHYSSCLGHCGKKKEGEKHQDQTAQVTTFHENSPPLKFMHFLDIFGGKAL